MSNTDAREAPIPTLHSPPKRRDAAVPRPRKTPSSKDTIGDRIRRLRLARGLTQTELGKRIGVSQRMVTYYEVRGVSPAPDLLVKLARALEVSVEALLGQKQAKRVAGSESAESVHLWRRLRKLQDLPVQDRKSVLKMIDALAEQAAKRRAS
jgi:transcriptional regulator with XRE-family HTH domain